MTTPSKTRDGDSVTGTRRADVEALLHRLRRAPTRDLMGLIDEHGRFFSLRELRQVLLNPYVDGEVLQALGNHRKLMAMPEARSAVGRHRRTPEPLAMRLIPTLLWRDLNEMTLDLRIRVSVRRIAERYLVLRLPRLSEGEKINLARRSVDTVAARLVAEAQPLVVDAGLENPRLSERALLGVVTASKTPPRLLQNIAGHPRWGSRYEIQAALCQNANTPYAVIFKHLERMHPEVVERVVTNRDHSDFLRRAAHDLLTGQARPAVIGLESQPETNSPSTQATPHRIELRFDPDRDQQDDEQNDGEPRSDGAPLGVDV